MKTLSIILTTVIFVEAFVIYYFGRIFKRNKIENLVIEKIIQKYIKTSNENIKEINKLNRIMEQNNLSHRNCDLFIEFINELIQKQTLNHQRYIKCYSFRISKIGQEQMGYMVFYEDNYLYKEEYIREKCDFDVLKDVESLKLECRVFANENIINPSLNQSIDVGDSSDLFIEELNLYKNKGIGLGYFYIKKLSMEVKRYGIKTISGTLSFTDFNDKDHLVKFYTNNGFEVKAMTGNKNGRIVKYLES